MRGSKITPPVRAKYARLRDQGFSRAEAARRVGVSASWAKGFDNDLRDSSSKYAKAGVILKDPYAVPKTQIEKAPGPRPREELCPEALRALDDIGYFGLRYFGVVVQPFQLYGTDKVMELIASPDEEYLVINQPPGSGKSTFYALILPAWLTARDRMIRGLLGSATDSQSKWYVGNLRDAFASSYPISAAPADIKNGIAVDAVSSLSNDFGRFRPEDNATKWAQDGFYVELPEGVATAQKEPTWSAFGRSSAFLGLRVNVAIWDDVYEPEKNRSGESRDALKTWWSDVAEKRLEPGGLLILQMQRLDPDDICHYALDMGGTVIREGDEKPRKYHHILFKAHYPEYCHEDHGTDARPFTPDSPETGGCLLYPKRIGWAKVTSEAQNNPNFEMVYQQADIAAARSLVDRLWINGGTDPETRELYPGCIDNDRDLCQIPKGLAGQFLSIATADPSPTMYWAVEWWGVRIDDSGVAQERYLLDLHRSKMMANQMLDWNNETQKFSGLMEEWQQRSRDLGHPITHWIVEDNAAQRFMHQYEHSRRWTRKWSNTILGHQTNRNKADKELGVQSIASHYRYGRVRLPYRWDTDARLRSQKLIDELVRYPNGRTDDTVMAHWFLEWNLPRLINLNRAEETVCWTPSWLSKMPVNA